jgi:hypothetical protein
LTVSGIKQGGQYAYSAEVHINLPAAKFNQAFLYAVPEHFAEQIEFGQRVLVEFNHRILEAYVTGVKEQEVADKIKPVIEILDAEPVFDQKYMNLPVAGRLLFMLRTSGAENNYSASMDKKGPVTITADSKGKIYLRFVMIHCRKHFCVNWLAVRNMPIKTALKLSLMKN